MADRGATGRPVRVSGAQPAGGDRDEVREVRWAWWWGCRNEKPL